MKVKLFFFFSFFISFILYLPFLNTFFVQDDFYLLAITNIDSFKKFLVFFWPLQDVVWYRPLSSQIFFFINVLFFGKEPLLFHLFVFITLLLTGYYIYKVSFEIFKDKKAGLISLFVYIANASLGVSVSWLATYSFILGPLFLLAGLLALIRNNRNQLIVFYVLGCLTSEIFILSIIPFYIFHSLHKSVKTNVFLPLSLISLLFIGLRLLVKSSASSSLYSIDASLLIPVLKFYGIRFFGIPLSIRNLSQETITVYLVLLALFLFTTAVSFKYTKYSYKDVLFPSSIIITFLAPFLLLPNHQAPYYISFSLIGFSFLLGYYLKSLLISKRHSILVMIFFISYLGIQSISLYNTYTSHWIIRRSFLAEELIKNNIFKGVVPSEEYFSLGANKAFDVYEKDK